MWRPQLIRRTAPCLFWLGRLVPAELAGAVGVQQDRLSVHHVWTTLMEEVRFGRTGGVSKTKSSMGGKEALYKTIGLVAELCVTSCRGGGAGMRLLRAMTLLALGL